MGFRTYLWDRRRSWLLALGLLAVLLVVLLLFRLPVLAVGYGALLCGVIYLGAGIWDFVQWSRRHHRLQNLEQEVLSTLDNLPPPGSSLEEDYQRLLVSLFRAKAAQDFKAHQILLRRLDVTAVRKIPAASPGSGGNAYLSHGLLGSCR